jgi:hypothetical protein
VKTRPFLLPFPDVVQNAPLEALQYEAHHRKRPFLGLSTAIVDLRWMN